MLGVAAPFGFCVRVMGIMVTDTGMGACGNGIVMSAAFQV
jgi:hypothetical protein